MRARAAVDVRSIVPRLVLELVLLVLVLVLVLLVGVGYMLTPAPALPAVLDIRRLPETCPRRIKTSARWTSGCCAPPGGGPGSSFCGTRSSISGRNRPCPCGRLRAMWGRNKKGVLVDHRVSMARVRNGELFLKKATGAASRGALERRYRSAFVDDAP